MNMVDAATIILGASMVLASPHPAIANVAYIANLLRPKARFVHLLAHMAGAAIYLANWEKCYQD